MIKDDKFSHIVRATESVCPVCLDSVQALVQIRGESVYLEKTCPRHGDFRVLLSKHAKDYKELSDCYFYFIPQALVQKEYYLCATMQCNISCPICFLDYCQDRQDLSFERLADNLRDKTDVERFTFSHGEPTVSPQLPDMIRALKRANKLVNIHTNGVRLADYDYALSLRNAGLDHVSLQFDGFRDEIYQALRGARLLDVKLKALENLKRLSLPVTLNVTVAKEVNDDECGRIFDYVVKNDFMKDLSYITYCHYSPDDKDMERYMMPDDLLVILEKHTQGRLQRENIIHFQKLYYAYLSASHKRKCFNYYHYFIVRTKTGYRGIDQYLDLKKIARAIDRCKDQKKKMTRWRLYKILLTSLKKSSLFLIPYGVSLVLRGGYPKKPGRFLVVTFASICDPYKYDATVALNCGQGIVTQKNEQESYGSYIIEEMKTLRVQS